MLELSRVCCRMNQTSLPQQNPQRQTPEINHHMDSLRRRFERRRRNPESVGSQQPRMFNSISAQRLVLLATTVHREVIRGVEPYVGGSAASLLARRRGWCELILGIAALHEPWHALVAASGSLWPQQQGPAMGRRPADREISDLTN